MLLALAKNLRIYLFYFIYILFITTRAEAKGGVPSVAEMMLPQEDWGGGEIPFRWKDSLQEEGWVMQRFEMGFYALWKMRPLVAGKTLHREDEDMYASFPKSIVRESRPYF